MTGRFRTPCEEGFHFWRYFFSMEEEGDGMVPPTSGDVPGNWVIRRCIICKGYQLKEDME